MTMDNEARERARELLFDIATSRPDWELPEPQATFSIDTAIDAMLAFAAQSNAGDREVIARIIKGARLSAAFGREFRVGDGRLDDVDLDAADTILALDNTLRSAVEGIGDDYMTSERHHPGYVLIPTAKFDAILAALSPTASMTGEG